MNAAPLDKPNAPHLPPPDEPAWSRTRWIVYILLAFGLHVILFYALGNREPIAVRPVENALAVRLITSATERQQLHDPTLFALPHPRGFAALTWLQPPALSYASFRWTESPRLLPLSVGQLGATFLELAETNSTSAREIAIAPSPALTVLPPPADLPRRTNSQLHFSLNLEARRPPRTDWNLPPPPTLEGLTNTVVQVLVNERGQVVRATLLPPGSGSKETDQAALQSVRALIFTRAPDATPPVVGRVIFDWASPLPPQPGSTP